MFGFDIVREIGNAMSERHYVLERVEGQLTLIQKQASQCHTNHSEHLGEFFDRFYFYYSRDNDVKIFHGWAENLEIAPDDLMEFVKRLHKKMLGQHPEKFV